MALLCDLQATLLRGRIKFVLSANLQRDTVPCAGEVYMPTMIIAIRKFTGINGYTRNRRKFYPTQRSGNGSGRVRYAGRPTRLCLTRLCMSQVFGDRERGGLIVQ